MTWLPPAITRPRQRPPSSESPQIRQPVRNESAFWLDIKPDFRPSFPYCVFFRTVCAIKIPRNLYSEPGKTYEPTYRLRSDGLVIASYQINPAFSQANPPIFVAAK